MSVAFRREGDDEHLEPKFEHPIPVGPNLVTARGLRLIKDRVAALQAEIAVLTDETALKIAKRDLRYWNTRQSTAELPPVPSGEKRRFCPWSAMTKRIRPVRSCPFPRRSAARLSGWRSVILPISPDGRTQSRFCGLKWSRSRERDRVVGLTPARLCRATRIQKN